MSGVAAFRNGDNKGNALDFNPFTKDRDQASKELAQAQERLKKLHEDITWYRSFDEAQTLTDIEQAHHGLHEFGIQLQDVAVRINSTRQPLSALADRASLGLDPRYWFSSERAQYKRMFKQTAKSVAELESAEKRLQSSAEELSRDIAKKDQALQTYRQLHTQIPNLQARHEKCQAEIKSFTSKLTDLCARHERVEKELAEPRAEHINLTKSLELLHKRVAEASELNDQLDRASNGYERAMVHEECERRFGDGSPNRVINSSRRQIQSIERNLAKLKSRLEHIAQNAMRVIEKLVFDGNNLCYQGRDFCGIGPVKVAVQRLAGRYRILIVFDASIRPKLRMSDSEIAQLFGDAATVHVVATKKKADETVLDLAASEDAYVVSNDRFGDFPEKAPVRERRLIRHEIVDGRVLIHDLGVNESFAEDA